LKTKIIYISGGENLDRQMIKSAFDAVRESLELPGDTILLGVPVDSELAEITTNNDDYITESCADTDEIINETALDTEEKTTPVIPILSVLHSGLADTKTEIEPEIEPEPDEIITEIEIQTPNERISVALAEELPDITGNTPQTIEDIFDNLTPLAEEKIIETTKITAGKTETQNLDDDATLTQLATEFIAMDDTPIETEKPKRSRSLKNILPFKKAKKDETGVLGDLFGWAGIAANEDDAPTSFFNLK
jgi:hypothetical protein